MKVGSLFSGIGGFDLAARWMGWETAWFSEIDPYASAVLAKHWPGVPNLGDITKIAWQGIPRVDLLCGGFPCQDISNAGTKTGITGEHSSLWGEFARAVRGLRPQWVVIENSGALLRRGYGVVVDDLRAAGYRVARPVLMSASAVGAPHLRQRAWVVAHLDGGRQLQPRRSKPDERGWLVHFAGWDTDAPMARMVHGLPDRLDRTARLGNAIVPQCAYVIFQAIETAVGRTNE